jgi:cysteine-rich repeat protein
MCCIVRKNFFIFFLSFMNKKNNQKLWRVWAMLFLATAVLFGYSTQAQAAATNAYPVPFSNGNYNQWTVWGWGTRLNAISTNDGDDFYVYDSANDNNRQTFRMSNPNIATWSTINSVTLYVVARKTDSEATTRIRLGVENGGTADHRDFSTSVELTNSYATYTRTFNNNPLSNTGWTVGQINNWEEGWGAARFGVEKRDDDGFEARVTQIYVVVNYTPPSVCGNGETESGETCDDGNTTTEACTYGEESCTVCNSSCQSVAGDITFCGDGLINGEEQCDDGNLVNGDGCSNTCTFEAWYVCMEMPSDCTTCNPGTEPNEGQSICIDCGEGSYSSTGAECISCEPGTFAPTTWSWVCVDCEPGTFADHSWSSECTQCPAGYYTPYAWSTSCIICPEGFRSNPWSTECTIPLSWGGSSSVWWPVSSEQQNSSEEIQENDPQSLPYATPNNQQEPLDEEWSSTQAKQFADVYTWAKENWLTTMQTEEEARMYDELTRGELAKMITNFVRNVLGRAYTADPLCDASVFADNGTWDDELRSYITQACSLGLMGRRNGDGGTIENFRAYDLVSRAEFATVMSRVLYGNQYNGDGSEDWYRAHLDALYSWEYMDEENTDISSPEVRWIVMLLMMRVYENTTN